MAPKHDMKILLLFDEGFPVDQDKLMRLLQQNSKFIKFDLNKSKFSLAPGLVSKPKTFTHARNQTKSVTTLYDKVLCFTEKQYEDNYFFHEHKELTIFSFYAWNYLTDLPVSNGVLYFIIDYLALHINPSDFRHNDITGCIYDFLGDKSGVDDGMRQSRFCSNCLMRLSETLTDEDELKLFDDLQVLMNYLSDSSRWNKDILSSFKVASNKIQKRTPKKNGAVQIVIASPGDTDSERKMLLDSLEVKFRRDNHEDHCGFRIVVNGWEDLASQGGYAQDVINGRIIDESDFVVAVFKHKLGTPTKDTSTGLQRADSGTAEELLRALDKSKDNHPIGMAYFFSKAPVISLDSPDKDEIEKEWQRLKSFKDSIRDRMIYKPYTDGNELMSIVLKDLEKNILDYIIK
jgi:hypothetical protein